MTVRARGAGPRIGAVRDRIPVAEPSSKARATSSFSWRRKRAGRVHEPPAGADVGGGTLEDARAAAGKVR